MIYVIVGLSLLFIAIGFVLTEESAKYLLSGYNTMNEEDRKKVDIKAYIPYFRNFHIFLGVSFLVLGTTLMYLIGENAGGIFLAIYPIVAYIYFITRGSKYAQGFNRTGTKIGVGILIVALLFVVGSLGYGFKEDRITFDSERISFEGTYGETLAISEVQTIELVSQLPEITLKTNGFALGTVHKGHFKTENGEVVKLILNSANKPVILLTKSNGKKIYYSSKDKSNKEIVEEMRDVLPNVVIAK